MILIICILLLKIYKVMEIDLDSNEVYLLDKFLYTNKNLETYYLLANEYNFDPVELISTFMDKLLEKK